MKTLIKCSIMMLLLVTFSCNRDAMNISGDEFENISKPENLNTKNTADVYSPHLGKVLGTSTLHRSQKGITVNFKTAGLIPGNAYTLWWVVFNKPGKCEGDGGCNGDDLSIPAVMAEALYAAGHVVGANGTGNFSSSLKIGNTTGSVFPQPSTGLMNPFTTEVHLVLRSHGPSIPGEVNDQIQSINGGCDPASSPDGFGPDSDEQRHCRDIQAAVHKPN